MSRRPGGPDRRGPALESPLVLTGGGTGGHLYPAVSIARALLAAGGAKPIFIGTRTGLEARLVLAEGIEYHAVTSRKIARPRSPAALFSLAAIAWGTLEAALLLRRLQPAAVIGTGGYVSAGVVLAAALQGIPTLIHEQNCRPGRTNRLLGRLVRRIAVTFPESAACFPAGKSVVTGLPVRPEIGAADREQALSVFGLDPERRTLLVLGGSQGARSLNRAVREALPMWMNSGMQILHQVGNRNWDEQIAALQEAPPWYHPVPYLEQIAEAYAAADLVVCRAGASTLAELAVAGLPALLVPYPHAQADHQTQNARAVVDAGAAILLPDAALSGQRLASEVNELWDQPERLSVMADASRQLGRPRAAEAILEVVEEMTGRPLSRSAPGAEHGAKRGAA